MLPKTHLFSENTLTSLFYIAQLQLLILFFCFRIKMKIIALVQVGRKDCATLILDKKKRESGFISSVRR